MVWKCSDESAKITKKVLRNEGRGGKGKRIKKACNRAKDWRQKEKTSHEEIIQ